MVKLNRFIQFNDEAIETELLLYERLGQALADAPFLELTERKLLEFNLEEGTISLSVFWRHREERVVREGRLSDLYLLTVGYWQHVDLSSWPRLSEKYRNHPLKNLAAELFWLLEEFRLMDLISKKRPGTATTFQTRKEVYIDFHKKSLFVNWQKNLFADSLLNEIYVSLHEGMFHASDIDWGTIPFSLIQTMLERVYDAKSTKENASIVQRIIEIVEHSIEEDLFHQYYFVLGVASENTDAFHYHYGMKDADEGEEEEKETIEEMFRAWHMETEEEEGIHMAYELEHGRSGKGDSENATQGNNEADIEEVGIGQSAGNMETQKKVEEETEKRGKRKEKKQAGKHFGKEHVNVVYKEQRVEVTDEATNRQKLQVWREEQRPFVRAFVEEMRKRIDLKENAYRDRLMAGRLSSKLTTLVIDERPKPFYRKTAPSVELDAVFGLLVDGSASMIDKLDETKQAVLLFHDVLRELAVEHEISLYYEDANWATREVQPNVFGLMHTFSDKTRDDGLSILSFDAHEDNRDGFAIRWMTDRLRVRPEAHKFLLVFSDGEPSAFGYDRNGVIDTAEAVIEAEKQGISVIHLFLSTERASAEQKELFSKIFGSKTAAADSVENFTDQTLRILRKLFAIVI